MKKKPLNKLSVEEFMADTSDTKRPAGISKHKKSLQNIKEKDPEFYKFLQEQDADLLNFDESDEDEVDDGFVEEDSESVSDAANEREIVDEAEESRRLRGIDNNEKTKAKKNKKSLEEEILKQDSDVDDEEMDEENEQDMSEMTPISKALLRSWEESLSSSACPTSVIKQVMLAFRAVVQKAGADVPPSDYYLPDTSSFNTIMRLCFTYFPNVWERSLGIESVDITKIGKVKWKRVKDLVKGYLFDLLKFLPEIQENEVRAFMLKHLAEVVDYFVHFPKQAKFLLKALIAIWITKSEEIKIASFVCIFKLVKIMKSETLEFTLKKMYQSISKSTTVVTPNSLSSIDFMRKSYAELCALDLSLTYQQGFVYIRQMAILLRNAIVSKKKDTIRAIYSWPFVHCLYLWCRVLNNLRNEDSIQPLFYPLIQVVIGCSKLLPTTKYIPLRLHCVKCLLILTENTSYHLPLFSILIEIMNSINFKKQNTRQAVKPPDFDCLIKLSTSQLEEFDYKPVAVEHICDLLLEIAHRHRVSPAFTELTFYLLFRLKRFSKQSGNAELSRKVRTLLMKIQEHSLWIEEEKAKSSLQLNNSESIDSFQKRLLKTGGGPLAKYYISYQKMKQREARVKIAANKSEPIVGKKRKTANGEIEDDEGDVRKKKNKKSERSFNKTTSDKKKSTFNSDIVKDFSLEDL